MILDGLPDADTFADSHDAVIRARGLTRYFGARCAVDSVSFDVPRGSVSPSSGGTAPARQRPSA
jgi:hypothetical protein